MNADLCTHFLLFEVFISSLGKETFYSYQHNNVLVRVTKYTRFLVFFTPSSIKQRHFVLFSFLKHDVAYWHSLPREYLFRKLIFTFHSTVFSFQSCFFVKYTPVQLSSRKMHKNRIWIKRSRYFVFIHKCVLYVCRTVHILVLIRQSYTENK